MERFLGRYAPHFYAVLRIIAGASFITHGTRKIVGWPPREGGGGNTARMFTEPWVAGMIEIVGGSMIMLGLFASFAAFIASGMMAVAYFKSHFDMDMPNGWIPMVNRGEPAVLFCFLFLYMAAQGSGIWSLDNLLRRRKR